MYIPISEPCVELRYVDYASSANTMESEWGAESLSGLVEPIDGFSIGRTSYNLISSSRVRWERSQQVKKWICRIDSLENYCGDGDSPKQAFGELKVMIHTEFQTLFRKRPFERTPDEYQRWLKLANVVDLLHYKTSTPIETRELGLVSYGKSSRPTIIKWISGHKYSIDPACVPGELMACLTGQWIEATVKRDPVSYRILGVESIRKISYRIPSKSEAREYLESLPEAELKSLKP